MLAIAYVYGCVLVIVEISDSEKNPKVAMETVHWLEQWMETVQLVQANELLFHNKNMMFIIIFADWQKIKRSWKVERASWCLVAGRRDACVRKMSALHMANTQPVDKVATVCLVYIQGR